jgi:hydrogenase maturation protease
LARLINLPDQVEMIAIIGCGNANRTDDGVGPRIIGDLRSRGVERDGVRLFDAGTDGMAAMFAARGCRTLIVIDACRSGAAPGAVFEVPGAVLEQAYAPSLNLHDFRWHHALHAGRMIFRDDFPRDVVVLLIEAESLDFGLGLSPVVAVAAAKVIERVEALTTMRASRTGPAP